VLKIALADDQALVRHGLRMLLETLGDIAVAIEAEDGDTLLAQLLDTKVDAILADIRMPFRSGIGVVKALQERGDATPVVLLTTFDDPEALKQAIAAGAAGYLLKDAQPETLKQVLECAVRGQRVFHPGPSLPRDFSSSEPAAASSLSPREVEILQLVAGGYSNKEVARQLGIASGTVKNHISELLRKLDARDRTHAVLRAMAGRLLFPK
jgi:DNA-binding NarL/FixJ family response regulator